ncbi:MAG: hypothetical protein JW755_09265 [Candidatus Aminicenantes bacterium]|nr:hypothetical protein [Candidatus Aminicenantes bacterium]
MIRSDFPDIFEYSSSQCISCTVNTNGTYITPKIARLMRRKGILAIVAIYGATSEIHDYITRNPDSFEGIMQGITYLQEAKANFIIQIVPMKSNYHQCNEMVEIAKSMNSL